MIRKQLIRQLPITVLLCLLLAAAVLFGCTGSAAWSSAQLQLRELEAAHTTIALVNDTSAELYELMNGNLLGISADGTATGLGQTKVYSVPRLFEMAADAPQVKRSSTGGLLTAQLRNGEAITSGTANPQQYNRTMDGLAHNFCVLAVECTAIQDNSSAPKIWQNEQGNVHDIGRKAYNVSFSIQKALSVPDGYSVEGQTVSCYGPYTDTLEIPFEVGKTYLVRGFYYGPPVTKYIAPDGSMTWDTAFGGKAHFEFSDQWINGKNSGQVINGVLATGAVQSAFALDDFLMMRQLNGQYDGISDEEWPEKGPVLIDELILPGQLPFWQEYTGDVQDFLASEDGALWREEIIPWTQLNQDTALLVLTDDVMTTYNFNTGTASILDGRHITAEEYENGEAVCLISSYLAQHNDWQVSDTVSLELYTAKMMETNAAAYVGEKDAEGKLVSMDTTISYTWQRMPVAQSDRIHVQKDYTIVGIYTAPEYSPGLQNFTAETIFVPKASVPNAELYENPRVNFCNAIVLENGTEDAFEAYMAEQGAGGYFSYFDMGYADLHASYSALAASARRLMLLSLAVLALAAAVYHLLWLRRFAPAVRTARLLGVSAKAVQKELFAVLSVMALIITATGAVGALLLYDAVIAALVGEIPRNTGALLLFAGLLLALLLLTAALCTSPLAHQNLMRNPVRRKKRSRTGGKTALQGASDSALPSLEPAAFAAQPALTANSPDIQPGAARPKSHSSGRVRIFSPAMQSITLRTIRRRRGTFALLGAVVLVGMAGSFLLHWQIGRQQAAWQKSQTETDVLCIVTDTQGSGQDILNLPVQQVKELLFGELSGWVREVNALSADVLLVPEGYSVRRILSFASDPALSPLAGASVTMLSGWDESVFATEQAVCLVPKGAAVTTGADGGRYITIQGLDGIPTRLRVIGVVAGGPQNTIHIPLFMPNTEGELPPFVVDSCSFSIADTARLEESRAVLYRRFVDPRDPSSNKDSGYGLLIHDETYLNARAGVESNIALLRLLLPILTAGMGILGFLATMLCTNSRRREFAVMRCLGVRRGAIFALVMEEQLLCALAGAAVALCIGALLPGALPGSAWLSAAAILPVFLAGGAFAALRISAVRVMKLMKTEG